MLGRCNCRESAASLQRQLLLMVTRRIHVSLFHCLRDMGPEGLSGSWSIVRPELITRLSFQISVPICGSPLPPENMFDYCTTWLILLLLAIGRAVQSLLQRACGVLCCVELFAENMASGLYRFSSPWGCSWRASGRWRSGGNQLLLLGQAVYPHSDKWHSLRTSPAWGVGERTPFSRY